MSALPVTALPAQVLVLGMHRSGTSVLTHLLVRMGCHPGPAESLQPGDAANPDGYWEHRSAWALDEEILAALGASWWEVADLDPEALPAAQRAEFTRRAGALVAELDTHRPWVLKDPRLCLLLPLWRPALDEPAFVLVHRDPLEVARSLQVRDGFPLAVGLALWEVYTLATLRHSLGAPRLLVSYQRLLREPREVAREVALALDPLARGALRVPDDAALATVVNPLLHRQRAAAGESSAHLSAAQQSLLAAMESGAALDWAAPPQPAAGALELLRWFAGAERVRLDLHRRAVTAEADRQWLTARDAEIERWNATLVDARGKLESELAELQRLHTAAVHSNAELTSQAAAAAGELAHLRQRDAALVEHNESLAAHAATLEGETERLRQRDGEISRWNEALTARLAGAEQAAAAHAEALASAEQAAAAHAEARAGAERAAAAHAEELAAIEVRLAAQRVTIDHLESESAAAQRELGELRGSFEEVQRLLGETVSHGDHSWQLASELDRLAGEILASRSWTIGRTVTSPARWGRRAGATAHTRLDQIRADAEELARLRRSLVARLARWNAVGGAGDPPGDAGE